MEETLLTPEEVAKHQDRLLSLAHLLSSDPGRAEDLVQETFLAALEGPVRLVREPGSWLSAVLRKLNVSTLRSEAHLSPSERLQSVIDTAGSSERRERLREIVRGVVAGMAALHEPYRSTLMLRYLEELSPSEVAARAGVPIRTVHTRTSRGLELLRRNLDRTHGIRSWNAAWIALFQRDESGLGVRVRARAPGPAGIRTAALAAAGIALTSLLVGVAALSRSRLVEASTSTVARLDASTPEPEPPQASTLAALGPMASRRRTPNPEASRLEPQPTLRIILSGRVIDIEGRPQQGVGVRAVPGTIYDVTDVDHAFAPAPEPSPSSAVSTDAEGAFAIAVPSDLDGLLVAGCQGTTTVMGRRIAPPHHGLNLVVGRRRTISGRVLDEYGVPALGVRVRFVPGHEVRQLAREHCVLFRPETLTNRNGRFEIAHAYHSPGASLELLVPGGEPRVVPLEVEGDCELELEYALESRRTLRGRVVDGSGRGVPNAAILGGRRCVPTDAQGRFEMSFQSSNRIDEVRCVAPGSLPVVVHPEPRGDGAVAWPADLRIEVALGTALAIEGRVVDANGQPVEGAVVSLIDPTSPGPIDLGYFIEDLIESRSVASAGAFGVHRVQGVISNAEGRFRMRSLLDREYRLCAYLEGSLLSVESVSIPAGSRDVLLQLPAVDRLGQYGGRLVSSRGIPMAGVLVVASREVGRVAHEDGTARSIECRGPETVTDTNGRFDFELLPGEGGTLRFFGEGVFEGSFPLPAAPHTDMVVTGSYAARLQVYFASESPRDARLRLRMSNGQFTRFFESPVSGRRRSRREAEFDPQGNSEILLVPDVVSEVVLYTSGREPLHVPVELHAGELLTLTL